MKDPGRYEGLPSEFSPPRHAADAIAAMNTHLEREAYFDRIPAHWQDHIRHLAVLAIADRITGISDIEQRRIQLAATPADWRESVRQHTLRLWKARQRILADQAAKAAA